MSKKQDEILAEVDAMAEKLVPLAKVDGGQVTFSDDDYVANLPADITAAMSASVDTYRKVYFAATGKAFGQIAEARMVADPSMKKMELTASIGEDIVWNGQYDRQRVFPGIGKAEPTKTHGYTSFRVTMGSARGSISPLSHVRDSLAQSAAAAFGG